MRMTWVRKLSGLSLRRSLPCWVSLRRRDSQPERGIALLEFTIVAIPLALFCFEMFDVANLLYHHAVLTQLAREGVRHGGQTNAGSYAALRTTVQNRVNDALNQWGNRLSFVTGSVAITPQSPIITGNNISVVVRGNYDGIFFPWNNFQIEAGATGPLL